MRVGQSRLMPRAERRVIECFVWRADPAKHSRCRTRCWQNRTLRTKCVNMRTLLDSCTEQFYGSVQKHFVHAHTVYTRHSPFFWEGPGDEARGPMTMYFIRFLKYTSGKNVYVNVVIFCIMCPLLNS